MNFSVNGIKFTSEAEGIFPKPYFDSGGALTVGIGHLIEKSERQSGKILIQGQAVKYSFGLTPDQIQKLFLQDIEEVEFCVNRAIKVPLTQFQYDAIVDFTYNIGNGGFEKSTLLKRLNQGLYHEVPAQMRRWVFDNGKVVPGLANRREAEVSLWNNNWRIKYA
jgi:lysozyme